jgi:hypothetical protein
VKASIVGVGRGIWTFDGPFTTKPLLHHSKEYIIGHIKIQAAGAWENSMRSYSQKFSNFQEYCSKIKNIIHAILVA